MSNKSSTFVLDISDTAYPDRLRLIDDPPQKLYLRGDPGLLNRKGIAIVGSRRCSEYGKNVAMKIAKACVLNGFNVISGMAIGIDNFQRNHLGNRRNPEEV